MNDLIINEKMKIKEIDSLNHKAFQNRRVDAELTNSIAIRASELSVKHNYKKGIAWSLLNRGIAEIEFNQLDISFEKLEQAMNIFSSNLEDKIGLVTSYSYLGVVCLRQSKMSKAFSFLEIALNLSEKNQFIELEYMNLNCLGIVQFKLEKYDLALRFFRRGLKLLPQDKCISILNNIGCTYRVMKQYNTALDYLNKALALAESDQDSLPVLEDIGLTYIKMGNIPSGEYYFKQVLDKCLILSHRVRISALLQLAELNFKQDKNSDAEEYLSEAARHINDTNSIEHRKIHLLFSQYYEKKGDFKKSLSHYQTYHYMSQELQNNNLEEKILDFETENLQKMNRRIKTISDMGKKITASLDRREVVQSLTESLKELFSADIFVVGEFINKTGNLETVITDIHRRKTCEYSIDMEIQKNIFSWALKNKTVLLLNNIESDYSSYIQNRDTSLFSESVCSTICVPYEIDQNCGVIGIYSYDKNRFSENDRELLEMLTSYAAIALNNTQKANTINEYNRKLTKTNEQKQEMIELRTFLLHIISHNAATPITILFHHCRNLLKLLKDNEKINQMLIAVGNLKTLIDNIMVYLKLEENVGPGPDQYVDIEELTDIIIQMYEHKLQKKKLHLSVNIKNAVFYGPYFFIKIILENMIDNAIKYSDSKGKIKIECYYEKEKFIWMIEDNGPGFTDKDRDRLYLKFQKLSGRPSAGETSNGLGLFLVKKLLMSFGGDIRLLETPEKKGACFKLTFPFTPFTGDRKEDEIR